MQNPLKFYFATLRLPQVCELLPAAAAQAAAASPEALRSVPLLLRHSRGLSKMDGVLPSFNNVAAAAAGAAAAPKNGGNAAPGVSGSSGQSPGTTHGCCNGHIAWPVLACMAANGHPCVEVSLLLQRSRTGRRAEPRNVQHQRTARNAGSAGVAGTAADAGVSLSVDVATQPFSLWVHEGLVLRLAACFCPLFTMVHTKSASARAAAAATDGGGCRSSGLSSPTTHSRNVQAVISALLSSPEPSSEPRPKDAAPQADRSSSLNMTVNFLAPQAYVVLAVPEEAVAAGHAR